MAKQNHTSDENNVLQSSFPKLLEKINDNVSCKDLTIESLKEKHHAEKPKRGFLYATL